MSINPAGLLATVALTGLNMALNAMRKIEGPRLENLTVTVADYGTPYNYFYGVRRLELPCVYAEEIQERKKKRKAKGGKYKDYTYFGTWACIIADHRIDDLLRIWFDRHLVLDRTSSGPESILQLSQNYDLEGSIRIYHGTETQLPDPRMQATIEAEEGEATCPAYRGRSYIFFEDIPLEKMGNRLPQVSVEVVRGPTTRSFNLETVNIPVAHDSGRIVINPFTRELMQMASSTGPMLVFGADTLEYRRNAGSVAFGDGGADLNGRTFAQSGSGNVVALSSYRTTTGNAAMTIGGFDILPIADNVGGNWVKFLNGGNWTAMTDLSQGYPGSTFLMHWGAPTLECYSLIYVDGIPETTIQNFTPECESSVVPNILVATSTAAEFPGGNEEFSTVIPDHDRGCFYAIMFGSGQFDIYRIFSPGPPLQSESAGAVGSISRDDPGAVFPGSGGITGWAVNRQNGNLLLSSGDVTVVYDPGADAILASSDEIGPIQTPHNYFSGDQFGYLNRTGSNKAWLINPSDLTEITSLTEGVLPALGSAEDGGVWDNDRRGIIYLTNSTINRLTLNLVSADEYPLADVIDDICDLAGMSAADYDSDLVTATLGGYSWTQGTGRDILEPLLEIYDVDARPHDFTLQFIPRGSSSGGTLQSENLVREKDEDFRYEIKIINDTDLPQRIFLNFADLEKDQQVNTAVAQRDSDTQDSDRELTIDLSTLALTTSAARRLLERLFRRRWFAREEITISFTAMELALEPADVRTLNLDAIPLVARLASNRIGANGILSQRWERDLSTLTTLPNSEGAAMAGRQPSTLLVPGLTRGFILDIPLLFDAQDNATPFIYFAAGPYESDAFWPGADVFTSETGDQEDFTAGWDGVTSNADCTWAYVMETLGDAVPDVIDNGNELSISLRNGTVESVTESEMLNSQAVNLALVGSNLNGWELIQFQTATLEADGTYTLTGLIRGIQGTEAQIGNHGAGEYFVLVSTLTVLTHIMGASEIGDTSYYRVVTNGRDEFTADTLEIAYSAAHAKPLSPAHVELQLDSGSGDWTITWTRRTRIGGSAVDGRDVPLGETSESYKVQIMDGEDIVRTITATSESAAYTAAQQTSDWGSPQGSLSVRVLQVSPALSLDGFYTAAAA